MKKKYKIIVISVIVLFLIIVICVAGYSFIMKDYRKLLSTGWVRKNDIYTATKEIDFPGEVIPNNLIMFFEKRVQMCNYQEETEDIEIVNDNDISLEDDIIEEKTNQECIEFDYDWKKGKIVVYSHPENSYGAIEVVYTYIFNDEEQLVLTYSGDGYEHKFYYEAAMG